MALNDHARRLLLDTFLGESKEAFAHMNRVLLDLAEGAGDFLEHIEVLRRRAHTLKGTAASIELAGVSRIMHAFEDAIARWSRQDPPPQAVIDASLTMIAAVTRVVEASVAEGSEAAAVEPLRAGWEAVQQAGGAPSLPAKPARSARGANARARAPSAAAPEPATETVRVSAGVLDAVLRRSEELAALASFQRGRVAALQGVAERLSHVARAARRRDDAGARTMLDEAVVDAVRMVSTASQEQDRTTEVAERVATYIREDLRRLRLQPLALLHESLRLAVHDAARRLRREARLIVSGADVRVDRRILDGVRDPLLHLVRNAVAHGIEDPAAREARGKPRLGTVSLVAEARGARVVVSVADDGGGIEVVQVGQRAVALGLRPAGAPPPTMEEARALIFAPGLSTSEVGDVAGRGVGLDVVRDNVAALGGTIEVSSAPAQGTAVVLNLPLTLASMRGLFVRVGAQTVVIPSLAVERIVSVSAANLSQVGGQTALVLSNAPLPFFSLADFLRTGRGAALPLAVVLRVAERRFAVAVGSVEAEEEVMLAALVPAFKPLKLFAGAVVRASGEVHLVLDPAALIVREAQVRAAPPATRPAQKRVMVVDDSVTTRSMHRMVLEAEGFEVSTAQDGEEALALLARDERPCDLVLADVQMPRLDGIELTRRIRASERNRRLPVVLVSALGTDEDRRRGIECGANAYIVKREYDRGALMEIVRRLL